MPLPESIKQGEDKRFLVTIAENGTPINVGNATTLPTICDSIQCIIKGGQSAGSTEYGTLGYLTNDALGEIQPHATDTDKVYLKLREGLTKDVPANTSLFAIFLIKFTDPEYSPDGQDKEVDPIHIANIKTGHAKAI